MSKDSIPSELQRSAAQNTLSKISQNIDEKINKLNLPSFFKNKFLLGGLMITALIAITLVSLGSFSSSETDIPTYKVTRGNFLVSITESGEIRAKRSLNAAAPRIRGNLKIVFLIPEGTYVQPGEVVAKFDPTEALSKLKDAEAQLEIARSDMEKLAANHKAALAQAESQLKSAELSFELSKLKMEQIKFEAEVKQQEAKLEHQKNELSFMQTKQEYESKQIIQNSELDKMKVEIRQKETELERAQRDLEALTLTAPGEGLVVYADNWSNQGRKYSVGDTPWGGAVVIQLPDLSEMESVTNVNEVDVSKIKEGQKVVVRLDAFRDSSFVGKISSVASLGKNKERDSQIKVFEILIDIKEKSDILKPGMTTSNKIVINEIPDVIYVPLESVFSKGDKRFVYLQNGSGFDEVEVQTGEKSEDYIVITAGINEGESVALRDPTININSSNVDNQTNNVEIPNS